MEYILSFIRDSARYPTELEILTLRVLRHPEPKLLTDFAGGTATLDSGNGVPEEYSVSLDSDPFWDNAIILNLENPAVSTHKIWQPKAPNLEKGGVALIQLIGQEIRDIRTVSYRNW